MSFRTFTVGVAALILAVPAAAQQRGTMEFGAFASAGVFDKSLTLNNGFGGGGRIGMFLDPRVAIEFEDGEMKATRTLGLKAVNVGLLTGRLVVTPIQSGALSIVLGAGAGSSTETNFLHTYGVNALVGAKIALSDHVALRIDAISDWMANYSWKSNQSLHVGLSFFRNPNHEIRTVEVPGPAVMSPQLPDSVSAEEQARRRRVEQDYRNLRDSLSRNPCVCTPAPSTADLSTMADRILFAFDKSELTDSAKTILDEKIALFRANPSMKVNISGHTDKLGTVGYNEALGMRRAEAAKDYIVSHGIDASRVSIESKGESEPVVNAAATRANIPALAPNRRDMFQLMIGSDVKKP